MKGSDLERDLAEILEEDGFEGDVVSDVVGSDAADDPDLQGPQGTYVIFHNKDSELFCRFASAACRLTKRRRRAWFAFLLLGVGQPFVFL